MEKWLIRGGLPDEYVRRFGVSRLLGKILSSRMSPEDAADFLREGPPDSDPFLLPEMEEACSVIRERVRAGETIRVIGDYDVDGVTATAILVLGLSGLGARVDYRIPERLGEGYGFSRQMAEECVRDGVRLALTCDNGIREFERAEYLASHGVDLVVTDHHEIETVPDEEGNPSERLPRALAVIDAKRNGCRYPYPEICGAFTAYQLIRALYAPKGLPDALDRRLLGYAALATVCDVMPFTGENRRTVRTGLRYLNTDPSPGIAALMKAGSVAEIDPYRAGFVIGPMLNAGGRLGSQNRFVRILLSEDERECADLARELYELNRTRQEMTDQGLRRAAELARTDSDPVKVIYLPGIHESIAGLVAGKLKERLNRPVFAVVDGEDGLKGSGRSIPAYSMFSEMCRASELFSKFGGHPMAAGFSLADSGLGAEATVERFRKRMNELCELSEEQLRREVYIDAQIRMQDFSVADISSLDTLAPYGTGNPHPLFAQKSLLLRQVRFMGENGKTVRLTLQNDGSTVTAILFSRELLEEVLTEEENAQLRDSGYLSEPVPLDVCYRAELDTYRGVTRPDFIIQNLRRS